MSTRYFRKVYNRIILPLNYWMNRSHRIWRQTSVAEKASKLWNGCVCVVVLSTIGISHYEIKEFTRNLILSQDTLIGPKIRYNLTRRYWTSFIQREYATGVNEEYV